MDAPCQVARKEPLTGEGALAQNITLGFKALVDAANAEVDRVDLDTAVAMHDRDDVVFIDIRDIRELNRDGRVPGAYHAPRGMLEAWIDPASPYHKDTFAQDKTYLFFCAGGQRSALAAQTAQRMGLKPVCHMEGGFSAWKKAGAPVEEPQPR